jgi:hypothetical protein
MDLGTRAGLRTAPSWLPPDYPPDCRIRMCPAGRDWDAVRAPYYFGETALDQLGETCGAVIYDPRESAPGRLDLSKGFPTSGRGLWGAHQAVTGPVRRARCTQVPSGRRCSP